MLSEAPAAVAPHDPRICVRELAQDFVEDEDLPATLLHGYGRSSADAAKYAEGVLGTNALVLAPDLGRAGLLVLRPGGIRPTRRRFFRIPVDD